LIQNSDLGTKILEAKAVLAPMIPDPTITTRAAAAISCPSFPVLSLFEQS